MVNKAGIAWLGGWIKGAGFRYFTEIRRMRRFRGQERCEIKTQEKREEGLFREARAGSDEDDDAVDRKKKGRVAALRDNE